MPSPWSVRRTTSASDWDVGARPHASATSGRCWSQAPRSTPCACLRRNCSVDTALSDAALRFGFAIPQVFLDGRADLDLVRRVLLLGEQLGYDSAWVQDQVAGDVPLHESLTLLSFA